jgi:hypothetical protein
MNENVEKYKNEHISHSTDRDYYRHKNKYRENDKPSEKINPVKETNLRVHLLGPLRLLILVKSLHDLLLIRRNKENDIPTPFFSHEKKHLNKESTSNCPRTSLAFMRAF